MFKRKTKPAHVRLQTHTQARIGSLAHIRRERKERRREKIQRTESIHIVYSPMTLGLKKIQTKQGRVAKIGAFDGSIFILNRLKKQISGQKLYTASDLFVCLFFLNQNYKHLQ